MFCELSIYELNPADLNMSYQCILGGLQSRCYNLMRVLKMCSRRYRSLIADRENAWATKRLMRPLNNTQAWMFEGYLVVHL